MSEPTISEMFAMMMARMEERDRIRDEEMKKFREEAEARERAREERHQEEMRKLSAQLAESKNQGEEPYRARNRAETPDERCRRLLSTARRLFPQIRFTERDYASIDPRYRKKHKLRTTFCDQTTLEDWYDDTHLHMENIKTIQNAFIGQDPASQEWQPFVMMYLNRFFAVHSNGDSAVFVRQRVLQVIPKKGTRPASSVESLCYIPFSTGGFEKDLAGFTIKVNDPQNATIAIKYKSLADFWLKHTDRLRYMTIGIQPDTNSKSFDERLLNTWTPRTFDLSTKEANADVTPWLRCVKEQLVNNNEEYFNYVIKCMAHQVQKPGEPWCVTLVFYGRQGVGKGICWEPINRIMSPHSKVIQDLEGEILGNFNEGILNKCFVLCDESHFAADPKLVNRIKTIVTGDTITIRRKYMSNIVVPNYMNMVWLTNNEINTPAEMGQRRFVSFRTSNRFAGPKTTASRAYFDPVLAVPDVAIYKHLMSIDLTGFDPSSDPPKTQALKVQTQMFMRTDPISNFAYHSLLNAGNLLAVAKVPELAAVEMKLLREEEPYTGFGDELSLGESTEKGSMRAVAVQQRSYVINTKDFPNQAKAIRDRNRGTWNVPIYWGDAIPKELLHYAYKTFCSEHNHRYPMSLEPFMRHFCSAEEGIFAHAVENRKTGEVTMASLMRLDYRPRLYDDTRPRGWLKLPSKEQARECFAAHAQISDFFDDDEELMDGKESDNFEVKSKPTNLIVEELPQRPAPSDSDLFDIYDDDPAPPVKSKLPTPKPTTQIAKEVGERTIQVTEKIEIPCAEEPVTIVVPKLSKPVSRHRLDENGRLSIAADATTPKSDPDPTPAPPTLAVQEKHGKFTFVKSGRPFQRRQDATPPEPNPPISESSTKPRFAITAPSTRKPFSFQRTVQHSVTVGDHEESDYDREESDDAADESDDADY